MTQQSPTGAVLLRSVSQLLPTHLVVVNLDSELHHALDEMAAFLPSFGVTILHVHEHEDATVPVPMVNEAQAARMLPDVESLDLEDPFALARATYRYHRPEILHALRMAFKDWSDAEGHDRTVVLFVGAPRTPATAVMLGELPLDTAALFYRRTTALPLVLRLFVSERRPATGDADRPLAHLLADLEQTYFALPAFPESAEWAARSTSPFSSAVDTSVWLDAVEGPEVVHFLRGVLRLHGEENGRLAGNKPDPAANGDVMALDDAMRVDVAHRSIDWLSMCSTGKTPRLWTSGLESLANVLDITHDSLRKSEPFASIGNYQREGDWDGNLVVQTYLSLVDHPRRGSDDLARADFAFRITDEDRASKLELARFLSDNGQHERAAEVAGDLLEDDPQHRLLNRLVGTDLYVAGHRERGSEILRNCIRLTEGDPLLAETERADEIATLHLLMNDYDAAISGYERAIDADPSNAHAYQGLVLIHRGRGEEALADHWLKVARRRELALPLVDIEDHMETAFVADSAASESGAAVAANGDSGADKRRSRWWDFFQR